jgi:alpha-methylacyl-CoA racemase
MSGPLQGIKIIEIAGIGPGPFAAMMLADMGADVIRVDRSGERLRAATPSNPPGGHLQPRSPLDRGRPQVARRRVEVLLDLVEHADALIEGFRPGVAERLGLGPDVCAERNPGWSSVA